jgi:hypothetical protein
MTGTTSKRRECQFVEEINTNKLVSPVSNANGIKKKINATDKKGTGMPSWANQNQ